MKKGWYFGLVIFIWFFIVGMGDIGERGVIDIPEPEKNYAVSLVDQADVSMDLEKFSFEGQTYFIGKLGRAEISIDFGKIDSVLLILQDDHVKAKVNLKDGKALEIIVDKGKICYGISSFANVKIELQDIKKITMHGKALDRP
ncbi:MAG: hypothetical protein KJ550_07125 [Proteobacteria bacterium]|nr:hypothetical protein [Desulfobacteraceae bacterium]MBU3981337.1 hypothetical protein [Pseudomonadota bacterium]MBU4013223.1 hypothetical protein [Pseudomonadota bacterium]MBU4067556.1 hypothetical protein [Pseudomonadota bacterium]MBU4101659.1 hypothetical protein [Pseudomonadota bacterium]